MLKDRYSRTIDYMRISITDRCNLRCIYCMPTEHIPLEFKKILTYEEIVRVVRVAAELGLRKIRLTGGEPLARKNVQHLIREIRKIKGIEDLSMTTNGVLLEKYAREIKDAGLDRVNVSLDSLRPDRYREITQGGDLGKILCGIEKAYQVGLQPLKINMVVVRGINDDEIEDFAAITLNRPLQIRFIEFMPGRKNSWSAERCVSIKEIRERIIKRFGTLQPLKTRSNGPARYYRIPEAEGVIGFISPVTHHFCSDCNRLRVTADGRIRPCLFSRTEIDLGTAIRAGATDDELKRLLTLAVEVKPEGHRIGKHGDGSYISRGMSQIGG